MLAPFQLPPDIELDLPVPPSVNRTRKINWAARGETNKWVKQADMMTMLAWSGGNRPKQVIRQFEATIVLDEKQCGLDLDNTAKIVIDYLKRLGLIADDGPKFMRAVHLVWGEAPRGCRVILRAREPN